MRRWQKLLKASRMITKVYNGENSWEFKIMGWIVGIWSIVKITQSISVIETGFKHSIEIHRYGMQCVCLLILMNMVTTLFTGFTKNFRKKHKNDFVHLTNYLPIVKQDLFKANYYDSIINFSPTVVVLIYSIILQSFTKGDTDALIYMGVPVLLFCIIIIVQALEIGIYMYTNMSIKVKGVLYMLIFMTVIWGIIHIDRVLYGEFLSIERPWLLKVLEYLGSLKGLGVILISLIVAYICAIKLPNKIYRYKE